MKLTVEEVAEVCSYYHDFVKHESIKTDPQSQLVTQVVKRVMGHFRVFDLIDTIESLRAELEEVREK